jgi:hypothetical protein
MRKLYAAAVAWLIFLAAQSATALPAPILITFEGLTPFFSPGAAITGIVVSPEGGILDEPGVAAVTGLSFTPGTVATSGTNLLGNVYGSSLTITFADPVTDFSVQTVGSLASGNFGTITVTAYDGASPIGSASSDPLVIGDSGAPEALLGLTYTPGITSIVFSSDIGGASSFVIDDLLFTPIPEPGTWTLTLAGILALVVAGRRARQTST